MADWEYLLQKEGDRSWLPLKPPRVEITEGRYRVVAHSNRNNTNVEIRITHYCTDEVPPKRRSQKRSHRTNSEGLMVVIPFTYIKPGIWDLLVKNDIMSDLLGDTWQQGIQLRVLPKVTETHDQPAPHADSTKADLGAVSVGHASSEAAAAEPVKPSWAKSKAPALSLTPADETPVPPEPLVALERQRKGRGAEENAVPVPLSTYAPLPSAQLAGSDRTTHPDRAMVSVNHLLADSQQSAEQTEEQGSREAVSGRDRSSVISDELKTSSSTQEEHSGTAPTTFQADTGAPSLQHYEHPLPSEELALSQRTDRPKSTVRVNDILADSLQMAELIFQQLVDQVSQESEPIPEDQSVEKRFASLQPEKTPWLPEGNRQEAQPEDISLLPASASAKHSALLLTLDQETLVAHRGKALTMTGRVAPDTTALGSHQIESNLKSVFKGTLRYQLHDPQNSQVLLGGQLPLPELVPPFAFTFSFELPPNCETRLILGEVTLCDARGMAIATQPFSITADLQELLGKLLQKSQAMPAPETPGRAAPLPQESHLEPPPEPSSDRNEEPVSLDLSFYNLLLEKAKNPQSFQPSPGQTLPPQITQASGTKKASKSPELPKLPSVPFSGRPDTDAVAAYENPPLQAMLLEDFNDEAGSIQEELVDSTPPAPTLPYELQEPIPGKGDGVHEDLQPTSSILFSGDTISLQPSEDLGLATSDALLESLDAAQDEVLGQELDVWGLPQTQKTQAVTLKTDTDPAAVVDLGLESIGEEKEGTGFVSPVDLWLRSEEGEETNSLQMAPQGRVAIGEQIELEKPEIIEVAQGSDSPESHLPNPPLPPSVPSNWQEDWAEFFPPSVPPTRGEEREELLSVGEQEGNQNPKLLEEQVQPELEIQQPSKKQVEDPVPGSIDQAFQALRMEERFWWRLNAMATDTELAEWIKSEPSLNNPGEVDLAIDKLPSDTELVMADAESLQPLEPDTDVVDADSWQPLEADTVLPDLSSSSADAQELVQITEPPSEGTRHPETHFEIAPEPLPESPLIEVIEDQNQFHLSLGDADLNWNTQEIVVDDELPAPAQPAHRNPTEVVEDLSDPLALFEMFEEVLVPTPELKIPGGELTSGELLTFWVKLPPYQNPIYVKLWIQDRESRSLLDGPCFLKDFSPSTSGELETIAQLTVPFGSLSIGFEAIAVDISTQRESHKVTVDRIVVPPDIPTMSLDEFED